MSNRGDRVEFWELPMVPGNPLYDEMEFQRSIDENPLPWSKPAVNHRLCITTSESRIWTQHAYTMWDAEQRMERSRENMEDTERFFTRFGRQD